MYTDRVERFRYLLENPYTNISLPTVPIITTTLPHPYGLTGRLYDNGNTKTNIFAATTL